MTPTEIDALNLEISEALEPFAGLPNPHGVSKRVSPMGAWRIEWVQCHGNAWLPRDWCRDEAASFNLLRRMDFPRLSFDRKSGLWECEHDWRFFHNDAHDSDPLFAVALAAREWLKGRK